MHRASYSSFFLIYLCLCFPSNLLSFNPCLSSSFLDFAFSLASSRIRCFTCLSDSFSCSLDRFRCCLGNLSGRIFCCLYGLTCCLSCFFDCTSCVCCYMTVSDLFSLLYLLLLPQPQRIMATNMMIDKQELLRSWAISRID